MVAIIGFLIYVIVFFIKQDIAQSVLGTRGLIADGVALKWVVDRRINVYNELIEAQQSLEAGCPTVMARIDKKKYAFFGKLP